MVHGWFKKLGQIGKRARETKADSVCKTAKALRQNTPAAPATGHGISAREHRHRGRPHGRGSACHELPPTGKTPHTIPILPRQHAFRGLITHNAEKPGKAPDDIAKIRHLFKRWEPPLHGTKSIGRGKHGLNLAIRRVRGMPGTRMGIRITHTRDFSPIGRKMTCTAIIFQASRRRHHTVPRARHVGEQQKKQ